MDHPVKNPKEDPEIVAVGPDGGRVVGTISIVLVYCIIVKKSILLIEKIFGIISPIFIVVVQIC